MSMVVHVIEFLLMSLVGIMLYKLYSSYKGWKESVAFSTARRSHHDRQRLIAFDEPVPSKVNVTQVHVRLTKSSSPIATSISAVSQLKSIEPELKVAPSEPMPVAESQPEKTKSSILDDYIGEFFTETPKMNLEPFRAEVRAEVKETASFSKPSSVASELEDEVISVEVNHPIVDSRDTSLAHVLASHLAEENIPTLDDYSDVDPDAFITVIGNEGQVKHSNKVMSDKVVLAMLDEAKLVCAS